MLYRGSEESNGIDGNSASSRHFFDSYMSLYDRDIASSSSRKIERPKKKRKIPYLRIASAIGAVSLLVPTSVYAKGYYEEWTAVNEAQQQPTTPPVHEPQSVPPSHDTVPDGPKDHVVDAPPVRPNDSERAITGVVDVKIIAVYADQKNYDNAKVYNAKVKEAFVDAGKEMQRMTDGKRAFGSIAVEAVKTTGDGKCLPLDKGSVSQYFEQQVAPGEYVSHVLMDQNMCGAAGVAGINARMMVIDDGIKRRNEIQKRVIQHEFGHSLGLGHAALFSCRDGKYSTDDWTKRYKQDGCGFDVNKGGSAPTINDYASGNSVMGHTRENGLQLSAGELNRIDPERFKVFNGDEKIGKIYLSSSDISKPVGVEFKTSDAEKFDMPQYEQSRLVIGVNSSIKTYGKADAQEITAFFVDKKISDIKTSIEMANFPKVTSKDDKEKLIVSLDSGRDVFGGYDASGIYIRVVPRPVTPTNKAAAN